MNGKKIVEWKYLLNTANSEFPLRTNYELTRILNMYNGSDEVEIIKGTNRSTVAFGIISRKHTSTSERRYRARDGSITQRLGRQDLSARPHAVRPRSRRGFLSRSIGAGQSRQVAESSLRAPGAPGCHLPVCRAIDRSLYATSAPIRAVYLRLRVCSFHTSDRT